MNFSQQNCNAFWAEAEYLPIQALVDYWCENDQDCYKAKFYALVAACDRDEIQYTRSDGKAFDDPIIDLANRQILLIHRESFEAWMSKFPDRKREGDILSLPKKAETTYLNIIGAMIEIMFYKTPGGRPFSLFDTQTDVINFILDNFKNTPGFSDRTLQAKFAAGKRRLAETKNTKPSSTR